jgi:HAD superfamily hydrolase (TIGR01509 family)
MDGLMFDSEPHSLDSWDAVLKKWGVALDQETIDSVLGLRIDAAAKALITRFVLPDTVESLAKAKTDYQIAHLDGNVPPMPGLHELLDEIDRRRLKKAVATSGLRRYAEAVLRVNGLGERFEVLVPGDEVGRGKPAPDIFESAAKALDIAPAHCLVLEDSPAGIAAAKAAGMDCVAVPNKQVSHGDLSGADHIVASLHGVIPLLPG